VPSGSGPSLGDAILDLVKPAAGDPPDRSLARQLSYILSPRTGASAGSVARQAGISLDTLRRWLKGDQKPGRRGQSGIRKVYERFWRINNPVKRSLQGIANAKLIITNTSDPQGIVIHRPGASDRPTNPVEIEASRSRKWAGVLRATTADQAFDAFVMGVIGVSPLPTVPQYLDFLLGDYAIRTA